MPTGSNNSNNLHTKHVLHLDEDRSRRKRMWKDVDLNDDRNHRKKHHFDVRDDCPFAVIEGRTNTATSRPSKVVDVGGRNSGIKYESKQGSNALRLGIPDWIAFHNKILRFNARCVETKLERKILYFLEDDTIQVVTHDCERRNEADGFRATFLKRHRIRKPPDGSGQWYLLDDLNVGKTVTFYGSTYEIFDCDQFTRDYLLELGIRVATADDIRRRQSPPSIDDRIDTVTTEKRMQRRVPEVDDVAPRHHPLKQFLENDGHVLQFYCTWDDASIAASSVASDAAAATLTKHMVLKYFLADDTVQVMEVLDGELPFDKRRSSNGITRRPKSNVFIRRAKLPKRRVIQSLPGGPSNEELRNGPSNNNYYDDGDFRIGANIDVWGRTFHIHGCDQFTRHFLAFKYGLDHSSNCDEGVGQWSFPRSDYLDVGVAASPRQTRGADDQSSASKVDFVKFMTKDRTVDHSHILRFVAEYVQDEHRKTSSSEASRLFIVSYHLMDDTISVFERPQRNSGNRGGKFMDRVHVDVASRKEKPPMPIGIEADYRRATTALKASDFYVGAQVRLNGHTFLLLDCDEYTKKYMERNCVQFPFANRLAVLGQLSEVVRAENNGLEELKKHLAEADIEGTGSVDAETLSKVIGRVSQHQLGEHQVMTLERAYGDHERRTNDDQSAVGRSSRGSTSIQHRFWLQDELRKKNFDDFQGLLGYLRTQDKLGTRTMSEERIVRSCRAYPLPLKRHGAINALLSSLKDDADCDGNVDYEAFVDAIDWKSNPAKAGGSGPAAHEHRQRGGILVDYKRLIADLSAVDSS